MSVKKDKIHIIAFVLLIAPPLIPTIIGRVIIDLGLVSQTEESQHYLGRILCWTMVGWIFYICFILPLILDWIVKRGEEKEKLLQSLRAS